MGKKYIITESQEKKIKLLIEQDNKFSYLVGKTINLYSDSSNSKFLVTVKIIETSSGKLKLEPTFFLVPQNDEFLYVTTLYPECNYSTGLVNSFSLHGYDSDIPYEEKKSAMGQVVFKKPAKGTIVYNKKLIDEINLKKLVPCAKPKADYSSTNPESTKMV